MRFDTTPNLHYGDMDYVRNWDRMITEFREQAVLGEAVGFTTYWLPEHHFGAIDGWNNSTPNPVLCAWISRPTPRHCAWVQGVLPFLIGTRYVWPKTLPFWILRVADGLTVAS